MVFVGLWFECVKHVFKWFRDGIYSWYGGGDGSNTFFVFVSGGLTFLSLFVILKKSIVVSNGIMSEINQP